MTPIVRFYANAKNAEQAVKNLKADGFDPDYIYQLKPSGEGEADPADRVAQEIDAGRLPDQSQKAVTQALRQERHVVCVYATYGRARPAVRILEGCDAVDLDALPESYSNLEGTRLMSDALGIPLLSERRFFTISSTSGLAGNTYVFNFAQTSNKAAPLSEAVGMKTVTERKKDWKTSLGLPLQSNDPAPLSNKLGIKTVTARKSEWTSSFGLPLLAKSPAPFSAVLGFPVLTEKKR